MDDTQVEATGALRDDLPPVEERADQPDAPTDGED
jgi:hypothetical protein